MALQKTAIHDLGTIMLSAFSFPTDPVQRENDFWLHTEHTSTNRCHLLYVNDYIMPLKVIAVTP